SEGSREKAIRRAPEEATLQAKPSKKSQFAIENIEDLPKQGPASNVDFYNKPSTFTETQMNVRNLVASPFTSRIRYYDMPDGLKVPTNLKTYDDSEGSHEEAIRRAPEEATFQAKPSKKSRFAIENIEDLPKQGPASNADFYNKPFTFTETQKNVRYLVASPFIARIRDYDMPDGLKVPTNLKTYDARFWYDNLLSGSINCFHELRDKFRANFLQQRRFQKTQAKILGSRQKTEESLKDYLARFRKETLHMVDRSDGMMTKAFISGLRPDSEGTHEEAIRRAPEEATFQAKPSKKSRAEFRTNQRHVLSILLKEKRDESQISLQQRWPSCHRTMGSASEGSREKAIRRAPEEATLQAKPSKKSRFAIENIEDLPKQGPASNVDFYNKLSTFTETQKNVRNLVASPFTSRIRDYDMPDGLKVPTNLKTYDGMTDPDDHLTVFMRTMDVHKLPEPAWCRFVHITLSGAARFCKDDSRKRKQKYWEFDKNKKNLLKTTWLGSKKRLHMVDRSNNMMTRAFISGLRPGSDSNLVISFKRRVNVWLKDDEVKG
nr:hypothetical protein [Tanacetum cinerariifolium]